MRVRLVKYARDNLKNLGGEFLHQYVSNELLPELLDRRKEETGNGEMTMSDLLNENQMKMTPFRWLTNSCPSPY